MAVPSPEEFTARFRELSPDELAITMGKLGAGQWELHLEDGETIDAFLDDIDVTEERGFSAESKRGA
jgi:hypothetical protein